MIVSLKILKECSEIAEKFIKPSDDDNSRIRIMAFFKSDGHLPAFLSNAWKMQNVIA